MSVSKKLEFSIALVRFGFNKFNFPVSFCLLFWKSMLLNKNLIRCLRYSSSWGLSNVYQKIRINSMKVHTICANLVEWKIRNLNLANLTKFENPLPFLFLEVQRLQTLRWWSSSRYAGVAIASMIWC